ncbi:DUF5979 domain-containing protein [Phytomonospora endophytica]|uniref:Putative repeat protein (TIGR01451 family)/fimbrial isopeptide formation D2 family protein/LPXTG-motif cell wall-anchored protein n=1 Tax=Phytomonospora endophytica TaxID=714109 RepID=A0A841FFV8_9ACTN|nr:DUF5979 domain-containing protein [Phytomonospora endophytica]MBB6036211.1 putative repeat protein (TIGR01451 family)/fimbrial isopeptide formation D2 family protein/LPXTG-motif cell wall-anchored protein [Phytomonospora endophytica]GIG67117.1 hypothetical protein Pen01_34120 [Phytomonospora endophytica]
MAIVPATPAWAAVVGIAKSTTGVPAGGVEPGGTFDYVIRVDCTSLADDCENVTVTDTLPEEFDYDLVPGTYTWSGGPDTDPPGGTVFPGVAQYTYTYDDSTRELSVTVPSVPAGTSASVQIGATLPSDTEVPDGTVVPNTATVTADNAPSASDDVDVPVNVPVNVDVTATKDWQDGSALAASGEASTITLGVTNASTGASDVSSMTLTDQTTGTPDGDPWNYFTLTGFGDVTYPDGADQVQVLYCTLPYAQVCGDGDWTEGAVQTGSPLQPDAGVDLAQVTGVQFVFSSSTGGEIPNGASGNVAFEMTLRDTERADDSVPIEPTTTQTVTNTATPSITVPDGTTDGDPASDTFQIVPNIAKIDVQKQWFADADGDYVADNPPSAPGQRRWPVSAVVDATNNSPFPVETMTVREPSVSNPQSGLEYMDLTQLRLEFPEGAETAALTVTCADGSLVELNFTAPPTEVTLDRPDDWTCPAGGPDDPDMQVTSIEVVYASPPGEATIAIGAKAGLDVHGTLTDNAVPGDSPFTNCADATAVNSGNGSTSATATACALLTVVDRLGPSGPGTKTVSQQELPEDTPIEYDISFTNDSGQSLSDFHLIDPASATGGLTDDSQPFASVRITELTVDCGPDATVNLLVPDGSGGFTRVPQDSATAADYEAARGFEVAADPLAAGQTCDVTVEVIRRDGVPDGVVIPNCYIVLAGGQPAINGDIDASTSCSPDVVTSPPNSAASLQKFIEPGEVTTPTAGLDPDLATVKLRVANTGNTHLKSLTITDFDDDGAGSDFFRSFDFVELQGVSFPPGADMVRVDVCTTGCADGDWTLGTATTSATPPLPGGVAPADIQGIRVTFTSSDPKHNGYNLTPGENFPTSGPCVQASVCFTVTPRATDRETGEKVLGTYTDTASGSGEALTDLGGGFAIPPVDADLRVVEGRPAIDVNKAVVGSASLAPGQIVFFDLTVRNSGTAALPDLEVSDPLPDQLEFDETAVNGGPYSLTWTNLPDGTSPPVPEEFTAESNGDGRVTRLVWKFPGRFEVGSVLVIRIGMRMAPGTLAGDVVTNVMGAGSSTTDDFDCSGAPPDGIVDGDPFLPGRNCTSPAKVTTRAGASFTARKWVAGNPELGLYDVNREEYVPIDDPRCPHLTRDGVSYTRYPCVALVYPGENFTFLARLTNSGTYRAVDSRFIDALPAPGDTGVVDPADRGTMWDVPPTLVAPPEVAAPSDGSTADTTLTYTTDDPVCADDLNPPDSCPDGAWTEPFDAEATGFQMYAEFTAPGLTPGGSVDVVWEMTSPADLAEAADPSIAWNSFGHSELIDTPGSPTQLGAVEPQKVGVGLVFGGLRVDKKVVAEPGATVPGGEYELTYECTVTPETGDPVVVRSGTATFTPDDPWTLTGVPAHASCVIYESEDQGGDSDHAKGDPITIVVPWNATGEAATATITNTFPPPPTPPTPPTPPGGGETPGPDDALPATGGRQGIVIYLGIAALLLGGGLVALVRRRRV